MGRESEQTSQTEDGEGGKEGKDKVEDKDAAIKEKALQKRAGFHEICKVEVEKRVQFENGVSLWISYLEKTCSLTHPLSSLPPSTRSSDPTSM